MKKKPNRSKKKPNRSAGKFIYAVSSDIGNRIFSLRGLNKAPVYSVVCDGVSAIVSDIYTPRVRPDRQNLSIHQSVLRALGEQERDILPMRFGVIAQNAKRLHSMVSMNADLIEEELERVTGKVEMSLKVKWDVPNIYQYFVDTKAELRDARDELIEYYGYEMSHRDEKIQLGRLYEELHEEEREIQQERVEEVIETISTDIKFLPVKKESDVLNLACLAPREKTDEFEQAVQKVALLYDNNYLFDYAGPYAPHNFVDLHLSTTDRKQEEERVVGDSA